MSTDLSFVLLSKAANPEPDKVIASAAKLGFTLVQKIGKDGIQQYGAGNGRTLLVMLVEAPHPDAAKMPFGPTSIPEDQTHAAHLIVTVMGGDDVIGTNPGPGGLQPGVSLRPRRSLAG